MVMMAGRLDHLKTVVQNTFSVYLVPRRDLQNALNTGVVAAATGSILYIQQGHSAPLITLPSHLKHNMEFRRVEGISGLIGAIRKNSSNLVLIEYSHLLFEEYEDYLSVFANECKMHARHTSPVILFASSIDSVLRDLGSQADRFISMADNRRREAKNEQTGKFQQTLADPGISGIPEGTVAVPPVRYGQISLDLEYG